MELLTIKMQQMTIESTNDNIPTAPAITYSECYVQCGDNLELLKSQPNESVNMIYCEYCQLTEGPVEEDTDGTIICSECGEEITRVREHDDWDMDR